MDLGLDAGVVKRSGAWYSFGEIRLGQGRDNSKIYLSENPKFAGFNIGSCTPRLEEPVGGDVSQVQKKKYFKKEK